MDISQLCDAFNSEARLAAVSKMIAEQYARAKQILDEHKEGHAQLAQILVEREVIKSQYIIFSFGSKKYPCIF